jgi:hypothetical protein
MLAMRERVCRKSDRCVGKDRVNFWTLGGTLDS